jgi:hypothetical protein
MAGTAQRERPVSGTSISYVGGFAQLLDAVALLAEQPSLGAMGAGLTRELVELAGL